MRAGGGRMPDIQESANVSPISELIMTLAAKDHQLATADS
jgi:hypothetical protein